MFSKQTEAEQNNGHIQQEDSSSDGKSGQMIDDHPHTIDAAWCEVGIEGENYHRYADQKGADTVNNKSIKKILHNILPRLSVNDQMGHPLISEKHGGRKSARLNGYTYLDLQFHLYSL